MKKALKIGTCVEILVGNFKGRMGFVKDYRENDDSYLLVEMWPEKSIPNVRWFRNEIKPQNETHR